MTKRIGYFSTTVGVFVAVALALILFGKQTVVQADPGCTDSTIAGTYAFALDGLVSGTFKGQPQQVGAFFPLSAAGTFSFDGQGNASRSFTVSFGGVVGPNHDTGSYKVHPNCTVSATFPDGTWKMVIVSHGTEIKAINATPGVLVQGTLTLQ